MRTRDGKIKRYFNWKVIFRALAATTGHLPGPMIDKSHKEECVSTAPHTLFQDSNIHTAGLFVHVCALAL